PFCCHRSSPINWFDGRLPLAGEDDTLANRRPRTTPPEVLARPADLLGRAPGVRRRSPCYHARNADSEFGLRAVRVCSPRPLSLSPIVVTLTLQSPRNRRRHGWTDTKRSRARQSTIRSRPF